MRQVIATILFALLPGIAAAQAGWQSYKNAVSGYTGAVACPVSDDAGHFYCLAVDCPPGGEAGFTLMIAGGGPTGDAVSGVMAVDGRVAGRLGFRRTARTDYMEFRAPFDPERHPEMIAALRAGGRATLTLDPSGQRLRQPIGLGGSHEAIGAALRSCSLPTAAIADPMAQARAQILEECGSEGSVIGEGFLRRADLDGDGIDDMIMDYGAVTCGAHGRMFYCGNGGCTFTIHRGLASGGFERIPGALLAYRVTPVKQPPGLQVEVHGSACGRTGADGPCVQRFVWQDGDLVRSVTE